MNNGSITLTDDDGAEVDFYILEETELGGETYLLVTDDDSDGEEAEALILREIPEDEGMVWPSMKQWRMNLYSVLYREFLKNFWMR